MNTTALVFRAPGESALEPIALPEPGSGDALVRIEYSGVSVGTETSVITGRRTHNGTFPLVSGYMAVGIVEWVGADVAGVHVGDRVVCDGTRIAGDVHPVFGAHAARHVCAANMLHLVPSGCPPVAAAQFVLPAVGLNAVTLARITEADTVVVSGQGLIGQYFAQWAAGRGARVIALEPDPLRAKLSRQVAGVEVIDPTALDVVAKVEELTNGEWPTVVVEATANPSLIVQTTSLIRRMHARAVFLSWYPDDISLVFAHLHNWEVTAYFPMGAGDRKTKRAVLQACARGTLRMEGNLTHTVPCEQSPEVMRQMAQGDRSILGMVIDWRSCE